MRNLAASALVVAFLSGCAQQPDPNIAIPVSDVSLPVQVPAGDAAVIIGMTVSHPPVGLLGIAADAPANMGWIAIDQGTGLRTGA